MGLTDFLPVTHDGVLLCPLAEADAEAYAAGTKDPAVRHYAHLPLPEYTPETVRDLARGEVRKGLESGRLAVLSILDAATEEFFGSLVLFDITEHEAEVGFWLSPHARGRGVARRALATATRLARRLGLRSLTARTAPENTASRRTLEAAGFHPEGAPRRSTTPSGAHVTTQHYRLPLE